jgi:hypothetical protein
MATKQRITHFPDSAESAYEAASNRMSEAYEGTEDMVRQHPATSLLVTFGVGLGVGLALTAILMPAPRRSTWAERNLPDWASRDRLASALSSLSHLPDKVSHVRPSSWW